MILIHSGLDTAAGWWWAQRLEVQNYAQLRPAELRMNLLVIVLGFLDLLAGFILASHLPSQSLVPVAGSSGF